MCIRGNSFDVMLIGPQAHLPVRCSGDRVQAARRRLRDERGDRPASVQDHQQPHVRQGEPKGLRTHSYGFY